MKQTPETHSDATVAVSVHDAFSVNTAFPEPHAAFAPAQPPLREAIARCDIVLDTNVLLLPYRAGPASLAQIEAVLTRFKKEQRLFIPAQVAREFARNRPSRIADLHQAIGDRASRVSIPDTPAYPLLEATPEYRDLAKAASDLEAARKAYQKAANALLSRIREWQWNDPVSLVYRTLFDKGCIFEPVIDEEAVLSDLKRRHALKLPPGYKDSGKDDGGIGDYLIWITMLDLGRERKRPLLFVSGEEKPDWQHRSGSQGFLPRFELVDEYRRVSCGAPFYMVHLSGLLELQNAAAPVVQEIKNEEARTRASQSPQVMCPYCNTATECDLGPAADAIADVLCRYCDGHFHVHRGPNGPFTHKVRRRPPPSSREQIDLLESELRALERRKARAQAGAPPVAQIDLLESELRALERRKARAQAGALSENSLAARADKPTRESTERRLASQVLAEQLASSGSITDKEEYVERVCKECGSKHYIPDSLYRSWNGICAHCMLRKTRGSNAG